MSMEASGSSLIQLVGNYHRSSLEYDKHVQDAAATDVNGIMFFAYQIGD